MTMIVIRKGNCTAWIFSCDKDYYKDLKRYKIKPTLLVILKLSSAVLFKCHKGYDCLDIISHKNRKQICASFNTVNHHTGIVLWQIRLLLIQIIQINKQEIKSFNSAKQEGDRDDKQSWAKLTFWQNITFFILRWKSV